ncbi:MAG: helix-turn-helix transcriptional regulator [Shimia sp.]
MSRSAPDTPASKAEVPLGITPLHQYAASDAWRLSALHGTREARLLWITKGQGRASIGGMMRAYGPNTLIYLPARLTFAMEMRAGLQGSVLSINTAVPEALTFAFHQRKRDALDQGEFVAAFDGIARELTQRREGWHPAALFYGGLLHIWLHRQADATGPVQPTNAAERLVRRYTEMVEAQYASQTDVAGYADALGVTPTHLSRSCRSVAGIAAHALLSDRVMHAARSALRDRDVPVKTIAEGLGFSSAAYFTRYFQGHAGMTPSAFRNGPSAHQGSETGKARVAKLI